jgi:hypothetical protein
MDFMLAVWGVAFAAFCIWLTARIFSRRDKLRRMIWAAALAAAALLSYPLSFGPACRLFGDHLIPESSFMTVYRPCIQLAHDGPQAVRDPLRWWVEQCGGGVGLMIAIVRDLMVPVPELTGHEEDVVREVNRVLQQHAAEESVDGEPVPGETER